jgi:regulator of sigma E protease
MIILQFLKPIGIILEVLVVFNLMIIVHELGHFLAARWRGLVIEKFGIWFGKPLWKKTINGVEYSLGSIPAGGFVALPQLAPMEVMEGKVETPRDQLPPISVMDKIIVAFAGPLFSFLLAVTFAVIVWQVGRPMSEAERTTVIGFVPKDWPAAEAGLKVGDNIKSVDGHEVKRYSGMSSDSIQWSIVRSEGEKIQIVVDRMVDGKIQAVPIWVTPRTPDKAHWWNRKNLRAIGIEPKTSFIVGEVKSGMAGEKAGLQKDDDITEIDGQPIYSPDGFYEYQGEHPTGPYKLTVERAGQILPSPLIYDPIGVRIENVEKISPAATAGLQADDVIVAMDKIPLRTGSQLVDYVGSRAGVKIDFDVLRGGKTIPITVIPQIPISTDPELAKKGKMGAALGNTDGLAYEPMGKYGEPVHPTPLEQIRLSVAAIVNTLDAVFSRKSGVGVQHMGGPVMMMHAYYSMLSTPEGFRMAIWFSVVLNVNLALLNLLPIPVLDGGHITLAILEGIRRKPINVRILEYVQTSCALVIIGFMLFIMFFDVQDLPFVGGGKRASYSFPESTAAAPK